MTKTPRSFQNPYVVETSLSDYYKIVATVLTFSPKNIKPRIISYRDYENFVKKNLEIYYMNCPK